MRLRNVISVLYGAPLSDEPDHLSDVYDDLAQDALCALGTLVRSCGYHLCCPDDQNVRQVLLYLEFPLRRTHFFDIDRVPMYAPDLASIVLIGGGKKLSEDAHRFIEGASLSRLWPIGSTGGAAADILSSESFFTRMSAWEQHVFIERSYGSDYDALFRDLFLQLKTVAC